MPIAEVLCDAQLAVLELEEGELEPARARCDRALEVAKRLDLARQPSLALLYAVSALVGAELGLGDEAKRRSAHAARLLENPEGLAAWQLEETCILLARACGRLTDMRRARTLLARASRASRGAADAPVLTSWLDQALGELDSCSAQALDGSASLTLAELRILRFLPTHLTFREIGDRLHVSTNTVKSQAHAVYRKLDASSRSEAVARAAKLGLVWSAPNAREV